MEPANGLLWEVSIWEFGFVTVLLSGGAAFMTGRAVALAWNSNLQLFAYMVLLACATRFIHFALFQGTLFSLHYYVVDLIVLLAIGFFGKRLTRSGQMTMQYKFEYERTGPLSWSRKPEDAVRH